MSRVGDRATVSTRSARLFAARSRARRWAAARPALVVTVVLALVAGMFWLVLGSGALSVHRVDVTGSTKLTAVDVRRAVRGVVGEPMLTINTSAVRNAVAAIPAVDSVTVTRSWPNRLRVTVLERRAVLATHRSNGWLLIDSHGVAFTTVALRPAAVLPVTVTAPSVGDPATRAALAVLQSLPAPVRKRVTALSVPTPAGVQLRLTKHVTVVWGGPEDSPRKAKALAAMLHRHAAVYDVSTPGFVTTTS